MDQSHFSASVLRPYLINTINSERINNLMNFSVGLVI